ncbi:hypothetical protein EGI22_16030 [Lacihabitans sp. LS3-19]|uniref:retropepsin-like aspartic protease family protein n=1 Tax=Lacihabitans sp. LS3-19 TaxID=2487335 RepID=UPI0020CC56F4|nr:retropepsin-like aspartic protease [Lacihabitans sp. LS3-19]MCP9769412.1 hypothetical protein [Lacihabitans sp. LS3-19]
MLHKFTFFCILLTFELFLESCVGCSNRDASRSARGQTRAQSRPITELSKGGKEEVRMTVSGGVYEVPVQINGSKMNFIFDTGASSITISDVEANFLIKQGTLDKGDVLGEAQMTNANGDVSSGYVVKLRSVQIGNRTLKNVEAVIIPNSKAPLLLGQTALAQFGKISIDYKRNILTFE